MKTKTCSKCGEIKSADQFYRDAKAADGLTSWCRTCKGIKGEVRYRLPDIDPNQWLRTYCSQVTCLRCDGKRNLSLFVAGKKQIPANVADAKALVRLGTVLCRDCADVHGPFTLTQKVKMRNRCAMVDERINETDYLVEQQMQLGKNAFLRSKKQVGDIEAVVHDTVVDKFTKRRMNKQEQDELNRRLPIITESKARTIKKNEPSSFDYLVECGVV